MYIHTITVVLIIIIELYNIIIDIGECMTHVHNISRIKLLLVLLNRLPNEIDLVIYNGMFF